MVHFPTGISAGLVTATLILQALLPFVLVHTFLPVTSNTGCSPLVSEPQLASAQPVSLGCCGGLVLACVPVVMAPSLERQLAFPTSTLMLFSVFL